VLPYAPKLDPDTTGRVIKAIAPLFHTVPSANLVEWVKVVQELSPDVVVAATPALTALDAGVAKRLIEAVAAINPDVLVATLNLLANLPSHAWDALIALVDMGVPAINLVGSKLSLLPITVAAPAQFQPGALSVGAITIGH
jgi:vesicle coat complex subunit